MSKPRIVKDYEKLSEEVKEMIKLVYPMGYTNHLVHFVTRDGEKKTGLPFETEEVYYLVRMSVQKAREIIEDDDDYSDGVLKEEVRDEYADKYEEVDYLGEFNSNEDNEFDDFGESEVVDDW